MKKLLIIGLLYFAAIVQANGAFEVLELCRDSNSYRLSVSHDERYVLLLSPSHSPNQVLFGNRANIPLNNEWFELRSDYYEPSPILIVRLGDIPNCAAIPLDTTPHNECLGIAPSAVNLPDSGVFVVDGIEYAYSDNLSFLVPFDMVWSWELWYEGRYILSFAQDDISACQIVGGD